MIVAIDGPDGAGKSTHVRMLAAWLAAAGVPCHVVSKWDVLDAAHHPEARFLRGTDRSELGVCVAEMPALARPLFVLWLYAETAARAARLAGDGIVVLDGFWMKHAAAELVYGADAAVVDAAVASFGPVDAVLYLDIEPEEALARKGGAVTPYECGLDAALDPARFVAQQTAIRARLLEWADRDGWARIRPGPVDAMQDEIRAVVGRLVGGSVGGAVGGAAPARPAAAS